MHGPEPSAAAVLSDHKGTRQMAMRIKNMSASHQASQLFTDYMQTIWQLAVDCLSGIIDIMTESHSCQ